MNIDEEVTADWARKTAQTILGNKVKAQVISCLESIRNAVKRNEMYCGVDMYADAMTIKELQRRGFQVKQQSDQRDGSYLTIQW